MPLEEVEKFYLYIPGVVDVYRKCRVCNEWKPLHNFQNGRARKCHACSMPIRTISRATGTRTLAITETGRRYLQTINSENLE